MDPPIGRAVSWGQSEGSPENFEGEDRVCRRSRDIAGDNQSKHSVQLQQAAAAGGTLAGNLTALPPHTTHARETRLRVAHERYEMRLERPSLIPDAVC